MLQGPLGTAVMTGSTGKPVLARRSHSENTGCRLEQSSLPLELAWLRIGEWERGHT